MAEGEYQLSHKEVISSSRGGIDSSGTQITLLLDGITDPKNLGSIFRLADAAGIRSILGYRTDLLANEKKLKRVSRQTSEHIAFRELYNLDEVKKEVEGRYSLAVEYTNKSIPFHQFHAEAPLVLIIGNEQNGVSEEMLQLCQSSVHIPMLGRNSSMNVSVATGIVVYHILGQLGMI